MLVYVSFSYRDQRTISFGTPTCSIKFLQKKKNTSIALDTIAGSGEQATAEELFTLILSTEDVPNPAVPSGGSGKSTDQPDTARAVICQGNSAAASPCSIARNEPMRNKGCSEVNLATIKACIKSALHSGTHYFFMVY